MGVPVGVGCQLLESNATKPSELTMIVLMTGSNQYPLLIPVSKVMQGAFALSSNHVVEFY